MIYLLEDDASIRELVCYSLNKTGTSAEGFGLPSELYDAISRKLPELVILDVMLPEEDGISVLRKLRGAHKTQNIPEFDKVTALDAGADDYVTKPFGVMELIARVKALLRRSSRAPVPTDKIYSAGEVSVSTLRHEVTVNGTEISLTYKEFELLCFLFENRGVVLNRDQILREVWGYDFDGENRTVDVHIRTLRRKLGDGADIIETIRGVGYKISQAK